MIYDNKKFESSCENNRKFLSDKKEELDSIKNNTFNTELKYLIYDLEKWLTYSINSYGYLQLASINYNINDDKFSNYSKQANANMSLETEKLDEIYDSIAEIKRKIEVEYNN